MEDSEGVGGDYAGDYGKGGESAGSSDGSSGDEDERTEDGGAVSEANMTQRFRRHVKETEDIVQIGEFTYAHILILTCGHRIARVGGYDLRTPGPQKCWSCTSNVMKVEEIIPAGAD